jgi:hypothetical protein
MIDSKEKQIVNCVCLYWLIERNNCLLEFMSQHTDIIEDAFLNNKEMEFLVAPPLACLLRML